MANKKRLIVVTIALCFLATIAFADIETQTACTFDEECILFFGTQAYCDQNTLLCHYPNNLTSVNQSVNSSTETSITVETISPIAFDEMQTQITSLEARVSLLEQKSSVSTQDVTQLQTQLEELNAKLQTVNLQQNEATQEIENTVSTGLASLQQDITSTKQEIEVVEEEVEKQGTITKIITYTLFTLIGIALVLGILYFINRKEMQENLDPRIARYITNQIQKGKKFHTIRKKLVEHGWSNEEIQWAYKETMQHNYTKYKRTTAPSQSRSVPNPNQKNPGMDRNKVIVTALVSILVIIGLLFILRGVTTGKAIHFQTYEELDLAVKTVLDEKIAANQFYEKLSFATLCVQVEDGNKSVSYKITKTNIGHAVEKAPTSCQQSQAYDFAVKFTNYNGFTTFSASPTCDTARKLHSKLPGKDSFSVYVLPSKHILPGFEINPETDHSQFCPVIVDCLNPAEKALIGC